MGGRPARLIMLVFHDDAEREYVYGLANWLPDAEFGTFPESLMNEAKQKGWVVIGIKNDWRRIFAPEPKRREREGSEARGPFAVTARVHRGSARPLRRQPRGDRRTEGNAGLCERTFLRQAQRPIRRTTPHAGPPHGDHGWSARDRRNSHR